jgi:cellulose synthase/poly-beta-1,6-N-acetylglucosamine synthase-like glycosyltransferase
MNFTYTMTWVCIAGLAYHYIGYPVIVYMISRLMPYSVRREEIHPRVSLIISAYNEETVIGQKIENTLALDYPPNALEIIVVTDGSDDATPDIIRNYEDKGVILLHDPRRGGKSAAINRAAGEATGEILVFSDANAFYREDVLRKLVRNFHDPSVGCVSGKKTVETRAETVGESESTYWKYESFIKTHESRLGTTTAVVGEMIAFRKEIFAPIPDGIINDDAYLAMYTMRRGFRVIYEPEAVCWETSAQSMHDEVIRRRRINTGRFQLFFRFHWWPWKQPLALFSLVSHKFLRLLLPVLMIGALLGNTVYVILATQPGLLGWILPVQLLFYILALIGWLTEHKQRAWKLPALSYFLLRASFTPLSGFWGFVSGKQTVLWEKANRGNMTV